MFVTSKSQNKESHIMRQTSRLCLLAGAVFGISGGALAESGQAWSNADEVRALVSEMQADAETRSSLLQSGGSAGHDGRHFFLGSADGNFRLEVSGQIQFRYYLNFRDDDDNNGDGLAEDDFESGFQTRRTKLFFEGHVFDPNLFYRVSGNFYDDDGGNDGDLSLEDAFAGYRWDNGFSMMWGQFKLPFLREELVSSAYQLAADRSLMNEIFNQGRSQGVQLGYEAEDFRMALAFSDGFGSENSEFGTPRAVTPTGFFVAPGGVAGGEADYAFTGRAEIKFAGNWDQFQDFTSMPGSDYACMFGVAGHIEGGDDGSTTFTGGDYAFYGWTADISVEGDGWNFYIAGVGEYSDYNDADLDGDGVSEGDINFGDYGLVAQFGMFIPDTDWEPFLRYDGVFADEDERGLDSDADQFNTLTFGANYYMYGHASKFTFDVVWFIDDVGNNALGGVAQPQIGYLTDDNENELTFRLQWQLLF